MNNFRKRAASLQGLQETILTDPKNKNAKIMRMHSNLSNKFIGRRNNRLDKRFKLLDQSLINPIHPRYLHSNGEAYTTKTFHQQRFARNFFLNLINFNQVAQKMRNFLIQHSGVWSSDN
jgi:hypothetical protein